MFERLIPGAASLRASWWQLWWGQEDSHQVLRHLLHIELTSFLIYLLTFSTFYRLKVCIALHGKPITELHSVSCHMGSHSVTCRYHAYYLQCYHTGERALP